MNVGSLFTGIGGLDLGLGHPPTWMCEYDKHCRDALERHFPDTTTAHRTSRRSVRPATSQVTGPRSGY